MSHYGDSFSLNRALASPSYAETIWVKYQHLKKEGKTAAEIESAYGISASDIGSIEAAWQSKLSSWKASTALDYNVYEIDDSDWDKGVEDGKQQGRDLTGYKGTGWQKTGQIANCTEDVALSIGGAAARVAAKEAMKEVGEKAVSAVAEKTSEKIIERAGEKAVKDAGKKAVKNAAKQGIKDAADLKLIKETAENEAKTVVEKGAEKAAQKAAEDTAEEATAKASEKAGENAGVLIACAADGITAGLYRIQKPNKKEYEAVMAVNEDLPNQQNKSTGAQGEIITMDGELMTLTDDANTHMTESNDQMSENKTDYDFYANTKRYLDEAKTAGHKFDQDEAKLYKECVEHMIESADNVDLTFDEAESSVNEIYDTMGEYEGRFDEKANEIAEVDGVTEYVENIDESTKIMCYVEGGAQTLNAGFAAWDVYKAGGTAMELFAIPYGAGVPLGLLYTAAAGVALAAGTSDGFAAADQFKWAGEINQEIKNREDTEKINEASKEEYDENIDHYALYMEDVEQGLELEKPDDIEKPEDTGAVPVADNEQVKDKNDKKHEETT